MNETPRSESAGRDNDMVHVGVVGCGLMGSGIAEVCARADLDVLVVDVDEAALSVGRRRIENSLARAVRAGKLQGSARERALARVAYTTDLDVTPYDKYGMETAEAIRRRTSPYRIITDDNMASEWHQ